LSAADLRPKLIGTLLALLEEPHPKGRIPMAATYAVAIFAMLFSGCSALTLINTFRHFDPPVIEREEPVTV
jgi:hypothetical protein